MPRPKEVMLPLLLTLPSLPVRMRIELAGIGTLVLLLLPRLPPPSRPLTPSELSSDDHLPFFASSSLNGSGLIALFSDASLVAINSFPRAYL